MSNIKRIDSTQLNCIPYDFKSTFKKISFHSCFRAITWPFRKIWNGCVMNIANCDCMCCMVVD